MAYIDFAQNLLAPAAPAAAAPVAREEDRLSALEWSVVALAQKDRMASLSRPGAVSVALGKIFGTRRHGPLLADPRLEALRRMAVITWHRGFAAPTRELRAFLDAGFTLSQYETMATSIGVARAHGSRVSLA